MYLLTQSVRQVLTRRQVTCGVTIDLLVGYEAKKRTAYGEDMLLSAGSLRTQGRRPLLIAHDSEQGPNNWRHYGVALGVALGYYAGAKLGLRDIARERFALAATRESEGDHDDAAALRSQARALQRLLD